MAKYSNPLVPTAKPKVPTYNMTMAQIEAIKDEAFRAGQTAAVPVVNAMCMASMLLALNSKLGYVQGGLKSMFELTQKYFEELRDHEITYADILTELNKFGVNLVVEGLNKEDNAVDLFLKAERPKLKVRWKE